MKLKSLWLPAAELIAGICACLLLRNILWVDLDSRGLILPMNLQQILLWLLAAAAAAGALLNVKTGRLGRAGRISGIASLALAAGILSLIRMETTGPAPLLLIHKIFLYVSAASLAIAGGFRLTGREPLFALQVPAPVFSILHLVVCYQMWSEKPQLLTYFFGVGGVLCIMLFSYGLLERAAGMKCRRFTVFAGTAGIFFCAAAFGQQQCAWLFPAAALWMLLEMTGAGEEA